MRGRCGPLLHVPLQRIFSSYSYQSRFGEESVEKMRDWAIEHLPPSKQPLIVEIGVGNGNLLFSLSEAGYNPYRMLGVDYSDDAVKLAESIAAARGHDGITFRTLDFLRDELDGLDNLPNDVGWELVLDKGTYDAMSLAEKDESGRSPCEAYPTRVAAILQQKGFFLITCKILRTIDADFDRRILLFLQRATSLMTSY